MELRPSGAVVKCPVRGLRRNGNTPTVANTNARPARGTHADANVALGEATRSFSKGGPGANVDAKMCAQCQGQGSVVEVYNHRRLEVRPNPLECGRGAVRACT